MTALAPRTKTQMDCDNDPCCPVCLRTYSRELCILKDANPNHEIDSECVHYFCVDCLCEMAAHNIITCPLCRGDISSLISIYKDDDNLMDD